MIVSRSLASRALKTTVFLRRFLMVYLVYYDLGMTLGTNYVFLLKRPKH